MPAYFPAQNTEEEVYRQIEKDLLEAISAAPDNNPEDKTRFSKSVARTLLAKVYAEEPLRDYTRSLSIAMKWRRTVSVWRISLTICSV